MTHFCQRCIFHWEICSLYYRLMHNVHFSLKISWKCNICNKTMYYTLRILNYVFYTLRTCVLFPGLRSLSSYLKFEKFSKIPTEFPLICYILGLCRPNTDRNLLVWQKQSTLFMIPDCYRFLSRKHLPGGIFYPHESNLTDLCKVQPSIWPVENTWWYLV